MSDDQIEKKEQSKLDELIEVMAVLRAPGGCPWDAEQTHESLIKYLVEETYELTQSDEDIVEAFRQVDAGMAHNVHLSHSNVVMISRDHYAALCDLAYGLPKGLTVGSD